MPGKYFLVGACLFLALQGKALPAQEPGDENNSPSLELLEFLGDLETVDGQWLDPVEMERIILPEEERDTHENE